MQVSEEQCQHHANRLMRGCEECLTEVFWSRISSKLDPPKKETSTEEFMAEWRDGWDQLAEVLLAGKAELPFENQVALSIPGGKDVRIQVYVSEVTDTKSPKLWKPGDA